MLVTAALRLLSGKQPMIGLYLLCALPLGIFMAFAIPLGQAPDEPAHMVRAAALLHGAVMEVRKSQYITGMKVDTGLMRVAFGKVTQIGGRPVQTLADYYALRNQPASHRLEFVFAPATPTYFPAAYLPATLGLALGLAAKLSPFMTMIVARLCMLAAVLLLGSAALAMAAYGEALLFCVLLMPMTLNLAGSLNEDGVLIGMATLSAAAMTRDFANSWKIRLTALAPLVLIAGAKAPYLPLLGLALLPFRARGFWRRAGQMALAAAPVLIWLALAAAFAVVPYARPPYHPGSLFAGNPNILLHATDAGMNLHILLADPARFATLPYLSWSGIAGGFLWQSMIGILGYLNLFFPARFYSAWTLALLAALLGLVFARRRHLPPPPHPALQFPFVILLLLVCAWGVAISLYLSWTPVGASTIYGQQGRYFLVLLPFLLIADPKWRSRWEVPAILPALPAIALGIYDLGYVPLKIIAFYYMY